MPTVRWSHYSGYQHGTITRELDGGLRSRVIMDYGRFGLSKGVALGS